MMKSKELMRKMPMMPEMFQDAMPIPVPPMTYRTGFAKGIVHNMKLGQLAKSEKLRADIATEQHRRVTESLGALEAVMTFGPKVQDVMDDLQHKKVMREKERTRAELENQLLYMQVEQERINLNNLKRNNENGPDGY